MKPTPVGLCLHLCPFPYAVLSCSIFTPPLGYHGNVCVQLEYLWFLSGGQENDKLTISSATYDASRESYSSDEVSLEISGADQHLGEWLHTQADVFLSSTQDRVNTALCSPGWFAIVWYWFGY